MISSVRGPVLAISPDSAIIEVGGLGVRVQCSPGTLAALRVGEQAQVATSLVVREDSLTLFGFADDDERAVFESVQTVSGIGPRLAQSLLAALSPAELRRAVAVDDIAALTRVPGIGRKGAQRLVLELKDRLGDGGSHEAAHAPSWRGHVRAALLGLGWSARDADEAVVAVEAQGLGDDADVAEALRRALRTLDRA